MPDNPCAHVSGSSRVAWTREGFVATDGQENYLLSADVFGATLHGTSQMRANKIESPVDPKRDGTVALNGLATSFHELAYATSFAANLNTLAVTTELTHAVYLIALTE